VLQEASIQQASIVDQSVIKSNLSETYLEIAGKKRGSACVLTTIVDEHLIALIELAATHDNLRRSRPTHRPSLIRVHCVDRHPTGVPERTVVDQKEALVDIMISNIKVIPPILHPEVRDLEPPQPVAVKDIAVSALFVLHLNHSHTNPTQSHPRRLRVVEG